MSTMKSTIVLSLIFLMTSLLFAQEKSEADIFRRAGYNLKHYQVATKLNLDVYNYDLYRQYKSKSVKGNVMIGVGTGLICSGVINIAVGASGSNNSYSGGGLSMESSSADYSAIYVVTGITTATAGTIVMIVGAIKKGQANNFNITKKDGSPFALDLTPQVDPIHNKYGMQLSLAF